VKNAGNVTSSNGLRTGRSKIGTQKVQSGNVLASVEQGYFLNRRVRRAAKRLGVALPERP
jgi:hypothetical protein